MTAPRRRGRPALNKGHSNERLRWSGLWRRKAFRWTLIGGLAGSVLWALVAPFHGSSSTPDRPSAVPGIELSPRTVAGAQLSLPLDAYQPTAEAAERNAVARDLLLRECLQRFGLPWQGLSAADLRRDRRLQQGRPAMRFGLVDERQAAEYGYHPPPWSPLHPDSQREGSQAVPADVRAVLLGTATTFAGVAVPRGGCVQEAERELSSGPQGHGDPALVSKLEEEADARADADPRKQDLFRRWSQCMDRAGFVYAVPRDAVRDPRWWLDGPDGAPGRDEITTAVADARCKVEVGYLKTAAAVTADYQNLLIDENADALDRLQNILHIRALRVDQILDGTGTS